MSAATICRLVCVAHSSDIQKRGGIAEGNDIQQLPDKIRPYSVEGWITTNNDLGMVRMQVIVS